jgi:hypothetical protein
VADDCCEPAPACCAGAEKFTRRGNIDKADLASTKVFFKGDRSRFRREERRFLTLPLKVGLTEIQIRGCNLTRAPYIRFRLPLFSILMGDEHGIYGNTQSEARSFRD